jgi:hypothetical protein
MHRAGMLAGIAPDLSRQLFVCHQIIGIARSWSFGNDCNRVTNEGMPLFPKYYCSWEAGHSGIIL